MPIVQLSAGSTVVSIDTSAGGRVSSLIMDGTELLVTAAEDTLGWGLYPMVPFAGRVRDGVLMFRGLQYELPLRLPPNALHGTVLDVEWTVVEQLPAKVTMTCDLGTDWPFSGTVTHVIDVVDGDVLFTLTLDAAEPQPAQVGWHPWFLPPRHSHHNFTAMLQKDVSGITTNQRVPVPHRKYDDCFVKPITMPWLTIGEVKVEISSDCSHWVIYNANPAGICFEPQSGPPNGINTEPYVVMPGKPLVRHMAITRIS